MRAHLLSAFTLFAALASASCSKHDAQVKIDEAGIVGTYQGRYFGGVENVEIRQDGTFKQIFVKDGGAVIYSHEGTWEFLPPYGVNLLSFMVFMDDWGKSQDKPRLTPVLSAVYSADPDRIELGAWPYAVIKKL
jgi:hypothetical protein